MPHEAYPECDYFDLFARHVGSPTAHGSEVRGRCPFHDDHNPSWAGNRETGLWRCFGCGAQGNAYQFAERVGEETSKNGKPRDPWKESKVVATYSYTDEQGTLLYQVVRFDPKDFRQRHPNGAGWINNVSGVRRVLYRLPEILKAETVYVVEGEKDVDRLWSLGIPATTNPQGAEKWQEEYTASLRGKQVVIIPDNDEPGRRHVQKVAQSLFSVAKAVKVVQLPGLSPLRDKHGEDVSDWLDAGHTKEELAALVKATPLFASEAKPEERNRLTLFPCPPYASKELWVFIDRQKLSVITVLEREKV